VYDKQVRRRRALLALLVACSLILLTAYFGESADSPLHSVQRGIVEVLSPIQEGASTVLKPVRDIAGWFSDTFAAKSQNAKLKAEVQRLLAQVTRYQSEGLQNQQLTAQVRLDNQISIANYKPVTGQVIEHDPSLWYETIEIDKGADDGVRNGDPVTGDGGLVGKVSEVGPTFSFVMLLTDDKYAVTSQVLDQYGDTGVLEPAVGNPYQLLLTNLPPQAKVQTGQYVVTAGFKAGPLESLYPPGIPIGQVSDPNPQTDLTNNQQIVVTPTADLRHLDVVQVLTDPNANPADQRAQVP
jgi:rod shape-determining protein MreC